MWGENGLCLHTPRADCNAIRGRLAATALSLPPHAPCRLQPRWRCLPRLARTALPPHAPCRLQRPIRTTKRYFPHFASTRPVQIATLHIRVQRAARILCLHTPRADCNTPRRADPCGWNTLPPHAPCRLQHDEMKYVFLDMVTLPPHAPCRLQRRRATD